MLLTMVFAVGLPFWLATEEIMRLRTRRAAAAEGVRTPRATKRVSIALSR